jgi:hypothetical protein
VLGIIPTRKCAIDSLAGIKARKFKSLGGTEMKLGSIAATGTLFALLFAFSAAAFAQLPPGAEVVPAGFKLIGENNLGATVVIEAKKPNENFPKPHMDQGIKLRVTWSKNPLASQILNMLAQAPEDPAQRDPGSATEPCGKQRYRDGVLICRKITRPWIGAGSGPDLVTYRISWTGKNSTGLVGTEIDNFCGSKETAAGWIDSIIPKITKAR